MKNYIEITTKYLKAQKKRTLLTIFGVIMSIALIAGLATIFYSYRDSSIDNIKKSYGNYEIEFKFLNKDKIDIIKNQSAFSEVGVVKNIGLGKISNKDFEKKEETERYLNIESMDNTCLNNIFKAKSIDNLIAGRYPKNKNEIMLEKSFLKFFKKDIGIGSKITLPIGVRTSKSSGKILNDNENSDDEIFTQNKKCEYTIVGIMKEDYYSSTKTTFKGLTFLKNSEIYSESSKTNSFKTYMQIYSKKNKRQIGNSVAKQLGLNININDYNHCQVDYNRYLLRLYGQSANDFANNRFTLIILFITAIIIVCTIAVIYNSFNISVLERISQFGILRSVGATPTQIRKIVFKEAFIISIIGIPLGIISGVLAIKIVLSLVGTLLMDNFDPFKVFIYPQVIVISSILGFITVFLSALGPSISAGRVSPIEAVRNSKSYKTGKIKKVPKGKLSKFLFKFEGQLAYKNLTRNRKRFIITVFSIVISIAMFITFNSLAYYTKATETTKGPVYYDTYYSSHKPLTENEYIDITKQKGIEKIYKNIRCSFPIPIPIEKFNQDYDKALNGFDFKDDEIKNYIMAHNSSFLCFDKNLLDLNRKNISSGSCDMDSLDNMGVILFNKNRHLISDGPVDKEITVDFTKYKVGDTIKIPKLDKYIFDTNIATIETAINNNNFYSFKIVGILDKNSLSSETPQDGIFLITSPKTYKKIIGNLNIDLLCMKFNNEPNRDKLISYFEKKCENGDGNFTDYIEISKENRKTLFQISVFVYGFITVISLIGAINIINSITTNLLIRKREFATLKAIGMSQWQIKKMVLVEGTLHGLIASFFGSIIGTTLSYLVYRIEIPLFDIKWTIPWKAILISTLGAILITLLSSFLPLRKINEDSIIENIRTEE